jgi:hypothetical protein
LNRPNPNKASITEPNRPKEAGSGVGEQIKCSLKLFASYGLKIPWNRLRKVTGLPEVLVMEVVPLVSVLFRLAVARRSAGLTVWVVSTGFVVATE